MIVDSVLNNMCFQKNIHPDPPCGMLFVLKSFETPTPPLTYFAHLDSIFLIVVMDIPRNNFIL